MRNVHLVMLGGWIGILIGVLLIEVMKITWNMGVVLTIVMATVMIGFTILVYCIGKHKDEE